MKAHRSARPSVRTAAPAALVLGAAVLLSGCGSPAARRGRDRQRPGHHRRRRPAGRPADQHGARGAAEAHPGDTLVSLILAPFVIDQAEKDGKGISEDQARTAVKEIANPSPATLEFVRTSLAANALSEQARTAVLSEVSKAKISVNPRYGTLDRKQLTLKPPAPNWMKPAPASATATPGAPAPGAPQQ